MITGERLCRDTHSTGPVVCNMFLRPTGRPSPERLQLGCAFAVLVISHRRACNVLTSMHPSARCTIGQRRKETSVAQARSRSAGSPWTTIDVPDRSRMAGGKITTAAEIASRWTATSSRRRHGQERSAMDEKYRAVVRDAFWLELAQVAKHRHRILDDVRCHNTRAQACTCFAQPLIWRSPFFQRLSRSRVHQSMSLGRVRRIPPPCLHLLGIAWSCLPMRLPAMLCVAHDASFACLELQAISRIWAGSRERAQLAEALKVGPPAPSRLRRRPRPPGEWRGGPLPAWRRADPLVWGREGGLGGLRRRPPLEGEGGWSITGMSHRRGPIVVELLQEWLAELSVPW